MATPAEMSFAEEVAQCARQLAQGQLEILGRLYDLTSDRLIRYARTLSCEEADAEDALQAAMVRVAQRPHCLAQADMPWAYFLRMVRNEVLKIVQRGRKNTTGLDKQVIWSVDDRELEQAESAAQVRNALRQLPQEQAEVVVLKIWEAMTFAEIAVVLGESPNTVASRYRYALEKMTRWLDPVMNPREHVNG